MANLNADEAQQIIENLLDGLGRLANGINSETDVIERNNRRMNAEQKKVEAELKAFEEAVGSAGKRLVGFAGGMTSQEGAFRAMGEVTGNVVKAFTSLIGSIPFLGKFGAAIKGLGEAAASAITLVTEQSGKAFATFQKMSGSGVIGTYEEMRQSAYKAGLTFEEFSTVMTNNSEAFAMFGQSAIDGAQRFTNIITLNRQAANEAQKLGISFEQFGTMQASYIEQMTKSGFARGKSDKELADGAKKYVLELDTLSKLTGKQREELQKEREKMMTDARFRAKLAQLESEGEEGKKKAENMKNLINAAPKEFHEGLMQALTSGGAITGEASAELAVQFGVAGKDLTVLAQGVSENTISYKTAMTDIVNGSTEFVNNTKNLSSVIGTDSTVTKSFVTWANLSVQAGKDFEGIMQGLKQVQTTNLSAKDSMAEAQVQAHNLAIEFQKLTTHGQTLLAVNAMFGKAMTEMSHFINELASGKSIEDIIKSRKSKFDFMSAAAAGLAMAAPGAQVGGAAGAVAGGIGALPGAALGAVGGFAVGFTGALLGQKAMGASMEESAAGAPGVSGTSNVPGDKDINKLLNFGSESGSRGNFDQLDDELKKRILLAAADYNSVTGKKLTINSAYRDPADQKRLYDETVKAGTPGIGKSGMLVARPGESLHESGLAVDIQEYNEAIGFLINKGLKQPYPQKDPVHFEKAARGALIQPSDGGTLVQVAEAGQPEAIVPLPNGQSIPVTLKNNISPLMMADLISTLTEKLDKMVDLLGENNDMQSTIVQNTA